MASRHCHPPSLRHRFNPKPIQRSYFILPLSTLTPKMSANKFKFKNVLDTTLPEPNDEVNFSFGYNSVNINPYTFNA